MGKMKELMIEMQENAYEIHLAKILGISFDDLMRLDWEILPNESDDGFSYGEIIQFSEDSPKSILSKIERVVNGNVVYLSPGELEQHFDYDEQFETIRHDKEYVKRFKDELTSLEKLNKVDIGDEYLKRILNRQIFIGVITTMETFLSDAFINITFDNEKYFRNFVETHPEFKKRKFELKDIFTESEKIKETAKVVMLDTIYHNLPTVQQMYLDTFKIHFPKIKNIYEYVRMRHDLVHRNGKTKEGHFVNVDDLTIDNLINEVNIFVHEIITELQI
mgnify:CR=1 FL=1